MLRIMAVCLGLTGTLLEAGMSDAPTLELRFAVFQTGSPVAITQVRSTTEFPYAFVALRNLIQKPISTVTLGIVLTPIKRGGLFALDRILIKGCRAAVTIEGGTTGELRDLGDCFPSFLDGLSSARQERADANLGIVAVGFADGSSWNSEVSQTLSFPAPVNSGHPAACKEPPRRLASLNPQILLAELRCDPDTKSSTWCTQSGTSCSMSACSCAQYGCYCSTDCDCRKCVWHQ